MAIPAAASPQSVQTAEESYRRCQSEAFFQSFYKRLLASHSSIPPKFARTDFARQGKLLQHSIGLLFIYAKRANPSLLERIAVRHQRTDVDVPPSMYPYFVTSLLGTVQEFDPQYGPEVEQAWREAVAPGIAYMASRYESAP